MPRLEGPVTAIHSLPIEILDYIFSFFTLLDLDRRGTIRLLSSVCRRWRAPAQRAIFATVSLLAQSPGGRDRPRRWLKSPGRQHFPIRALRLHGVAMSKKVLETCGGLRHLEAQDVPFSHLRLRTLAGQSALFSRSGMTEG